MDDVLFLAVALADVPDWLLVALAVAAFAAVVLVAWLLAGER